MERNRKKEEGGWILRRKSERWRRSERKRVEEKELERQKDKREGHQGA